ncbi:MFS transporter [Nakamurella flavida]|uniref:MFS transporter n=2 Tax=Nakamurella flavida TaxID=363630 RepID=A0A939C0D1_9ACTN|nr:MFS transporter [Nakamurella flavida]MBM9476593.1 MFS transporter [Nakamurella flavida]
MPREVVVLVGAAFLVAVGYGLIAPVLPAYASGFGVSTTAVSVIVSAFALARLLFSPFAGRLLRRLAERPLYLAGLLIVAASSVAIAYSPGYSGLLIARSAGGIGSALFTISGLALLVRVTPAALRGRASAMYATGFLLGGISGPLVGGLLATWSIRAPFLGYGALLVVAAAVVQFSLRRIPNPVRDSTVVPVDLRETLRLNAFQAVLSSNFAVGWSVFGIRMALVPLFVVQVLDAGEAMAGWALTVFAIGNAAVLTVVGRWVDRVGRRRPMIIGLVVSAASLGLLGISTQVWQLLALCLLGGLGSGLITPAQQAVVADVMGGRPGGSVLAVYQMTGDVGAVVGPIVAGLLVDANGFGVALGVGAAVVLATVPLWFRAPETLPPRPPAQPAARP